MSTPRILSLGFFVLFSLFVFAPKADAQAQIRPRIAGQTKPNKVVSTVQERPVNAPNNGGAIVIPSAPRAANVENSVMSRPSNAPKTVLTNDIMVRPTAAVTAKNTAAVTTKAAGGGIAAGLGAFRGRLLTSMNSKLGIPYRYGSEGPNTYDCSALVWTVFGEAGIKFDRNSARTYWNNFEPVADEDKYKFGTLVFFNKLGHVGIVIDENTFYHASSSKGVTYSKFAGYWSKRIVGFRRIPLNQLPAILEGK